MVKLRHTGILVHDLEMSIKLYCEVFEFEVVNKGAVMGKFAEQLFNLSNFHLNYVKLKSKHCSTMLELWNIKEFVKSDNPGGFSHIALTVKNLNEIYEKLREKEIKFFSPPIKAQDSEVRLCFCKDYDGNIIELVEDPKKTRKSSLKS